MKKKGKEKKRRDFLYQATKAVKKAQQSNLTISSHAPIQKEKKKKKTLLLASY